MREPGHRQGQIAHRPHTGRDVRTDRTTRPAKRPNGAVLLSGPAPFRPEVHPWTPCAGVRPVRCNAVPKTRRNETREQGASYPPERDAAPFPLPRYGDLASPCPGQAPAGCPQPSPSITNRTRSGRDAQAVRGRPRLRKPDEYPPLRSACPTHATPPATGIQAPGAVSADSSVPALPTLASTSPARIISQNSRMPGTAATVVSR